ncbi:MAG TPA: hypothetical protein VNN80_17510, partial [Polyangiaceae bacterium]|nr:hypothetical protein [Polyangiaceae bacterium]
MNTRQIIGAALTLIVSACSSDDEAPALAPPSSQSPALEPNAPGAVPPGATPPGAMPNAEAPNEPEGDMPAASPSEGQQVTDLTIPEATPGSGEASPPAPAPGEEMTGSEADPAAPVPGGLAPAVPSAGCGQARTLQDGNQTIASGGMDRTYLLETPDGYDNTYPHRVVFMFHWNYGSINAIVNPPDADRNTDRPFYGMGDLTDDKTIFVVPQGLVGPTGGAGWDNP